MPKNINTFVAVMTYYLEEYAKDVPLSFRQQYVNNMLTVVQNINAALENSLNGDLLKAHIAYQNLNLLLENRRIEYFFKVMPLEDIQQHLSRIITKACVTSDATLESKEIDSFLESKLESCIVQLFNLLAENYFSLPLIFEKLAFFITSTLVDSGCIVRSYDIYEKFHVTVNAELLALLEYVAVETDVDFCTHQIKKYLPNVYVLCISNIPAKSTSINPAFVMHNLDFSFFAAANRTFNQRWVQMFENRFSTYLLMHRTWLRNLSLEISKEDADAAIRKNWNAKRDLKEQISPIVVSEVKEYFLSWLPTYRPDLQPFVNELLQYKDQLVVNRVSRDLTSKICKKMDFYFQLPSFMSFRNQEPVSASHPKAHLSF